MLGSWSKPLRTLFQTRNCTELNNNKTLFNAFAQPVRSLQRLAIVLYCTHDLFLTSKQRCDDKNRPVEHLRPIRAILNVILVVVCGSCERLFWMEAVKVLHELVGLCKDQDCCFTALSMLIGRENDGLNWEHAPAVQEAKWRLWGMCWEDRKNCDVASRSAENWACSTTGWFHIGRSLVSGWGLDNVCRSTRIGRVYNVWRVMMLWKTNVLFYWKANVKKAKSISRISPWEECAVQHRRMEEECSKDYVNLMLTQYADGRDGRRCLLWKVGSRCCPLCDAHAGSIDSTNSILEVSHSILVQWELPMFDWRLDRNWFRLGKSLLFDWWAVLNWEDRYEMDRKRSRELFLTVRKPALWWSE